MIKTIFNTEIDTQKFYTHLTPPKKKNGKFIKYGFIDVTQYCNINPTTGDWEIKPEYFVLFSNLGIRGKQNIDRQIEILVHRLNRHKLKNQYFPPTIDEKNMLDIEDGRKRIMAHIKAKEKYCAVAIYRFDRKEESLKSKLTNGFQSNFHDPADPSDIDGIVDACGELIKGGELNQIEYDIREYLIDYAEIDDYFPTKTINGIIGQVMALDKGGKKQILSLERDKAISYLKKSLGFDYILKNETQQDKEIVLYTPGLANAYRTYCKHIAPNSRTKKRTEIYLYTQGYDIVKVNNDIDEYVKTLKQVIGDCSYVINYDAAGIKLQEPWVSTLWEIKGVIPQKQTTHQKLMFESFNTINIEEFKNK